MDVKRVERACELVIYVLEIISILVPVGDPIWQYLEFIIFCLRLFRLLTSGKSNQKNK